MSTSKRINRTDGEWEGPVVHQDIRMDDTAIAFRMLLQPDQIQ